VPPDVLRERFLALPQDAIIVPGNVRENLDPGATLSDSECIIYLQKVGLWEFLETRGGLDATVNEKLLSAGQGQLLILGRALAHPKQIILMDEITSR
jgi:ABC-type transport system involved in cytochrome bd biosynthesis fused ATPase/permease subunit